jgi:ATP-dependent RNA helicase RhlB
VTPSSPLAETEAAVAEPSADFRALPIPEVVLQGIDAVGFQTCTPIQARVLPLSLAGKDVAGQAQTGTGKTAAFLITTFTRLLAGQGPAPRSGPRALMIAPTRELAMQIYTDAQSLGQFTGLSMHAVYGGIDYQGQRDRLRHGCDILIGTPGRLIDYLKQRVYSLRGVEVLVIDEADRLFDMGFLRDLRFLLRRLPPYHKRQSMLFSATLSYAVMDLAYEHMNDAVKVAASPKQLTAEKVEHMIYHVGSDEKLPLLLGFFRRQQPARTLIFTNMKRTADWLAHRLTENGNPARAITGDLVQRLRLRLVHDFKSGKLPILVATDVASRGLHIDDVTHVINYDVPQDPEDYVHRVGRTARAGASGHAVTLACEEYVEALEQIEELVGFKLPIGELSDDDFVQPEPTRHKRSEDRRRPRRGRPSGPGPGRGHRRRR